MHYPKVLERADSPEQIFHRSFSLGAPVVSHSITNLYLSKQSRFVAIFLFDVIMVKIIR